MKHFKKLVSLLLATIMVFGLAATALATGPNPSGSITINNAVVNHTYNVYRLMYPSDTEGEYVANGDTWLAWLKTQQGTYVTIDETNNHVTLINEIDLAAFGKLALAHAMGNNIEATATTKATSNSVQFTGLELGYYLADSTSEVICNLNSTNSAATMNADTFTPPEGTQDGGKITVEGAVVKHTYKIYQLMYVTSYSNENNTPVYSYKANSQWETFLRSPGAQTYVSVDTNGYVTWKAGNDDATAATFAKLALEYATDNGILPNAEPITAEAGTPVEFTNLPMGYYLLDSTLGALCSLDTNNDAVNIKEKNEHPGNVKEVQEDSDNSWGEVNDADIGDTVNFRSTVTIPVGSEKVIYHDTMSDGLSFPENSTIEVVTCTVTQNGSNPPTITEGAPLDEGYYTFTWNPGHQHGEGGNAKDCTFTVTFDPDYLAALTETVTLRIKYSATIDADAVIDGDGNDNSSHLSYGHDGTTETTPSTTTTYVWKFSVHKTDGQTGDNLEGVEFILLNEDKTQAATFSKDTASGKYKITGWKDLDADGNPYDESTPDNPNDIIDVTNPDNWPDYYVLTTGPDGYINVEGMDSGTYYLREIKALPDYNKVDDRDFQINYTTGQDETITPPNVTIEVENNKGTEMPETGGIGTTIFYVVGSILLVGAVVLLITKKRMSVSK